MKKSEKRHKMRGTVRLLLIAVCCQLFSAFAQEPSAPSDMTYIPSGEFIMGNDEGTPTERPAHRVYLDAYYIARHEVTNAEYYAFWIADGGAESSHTPISYGKRAGIGNWPQIARTKPDYPIVGVSWADAVSYAKWADKRLPTEAEWEKAARGNDGRLWPWGNIFSVPTHGITVHANVWEGNDGFDNGLAPVGSYSTGASAFGVLDMAGNVWEWVADWYSDTYYSHSLAENPRGPKTGSRRVLRGGSWVNGPQLVGSTIHMGQHPAVGTSFIGFRLAKDVEKEIRK